MKLKQTSRILSLLALGCLFVVSGLKAADHVVKVDYTGGSVVVSPKVIQANVGDKVTYELVNSGRLILTFFLPFEAINIPGTIDPRRVSFTVKYSGTYKIGCSAIINGELEGWLAGDKNAGGEIEPVSGT